MAEDSVNVALKEWAVVCRALASGRQTVLLRKGGVYEARRGFAVQHERFVLFPTYLHQSLAQLKPEAHAGFEARASEPERVELSLLVTVADVVRIEARAQLDAIGDEHVWAGPLIDMRLGYKPENPLLLVVGRVWALPTPVVVANDATYAGCKSWVPLKAGVGVRGARAVLGDDEFEARRARIVRAVS